MPGRDSRRAYLVMAVGIFAYMVAVAQRTSFGVASTEAADRFGAAASELSMFTMLQVLVYAGMQIPVGVLVDRFGSRSLVAIGASLMIVGQVLLGLADSVGTGVVARVFVGAGDAMTFVCVLKIVPAWFSLARQPMVTMLIGAVGNMGQLLSVIPFSLLLGLVGWLPSFLSMSALSVLSLVLVLTFLRDTPAGSDTAVQPPSLLRVRLRLARSLRDPVTGLAFWLHFTVQFIGNVFAMMWGYPYLQNAQGLSMGQASFVMTFFVLANMVVGIVLGGILGRYPQHRVRVGFTVIGLGTLAWLTLLLWPGQAPFLVVLLAVVLIAISLPASMLAFNVIQAYTPVRRTGTATGITNVGGFVATLIAVLLIGLALDLQLALGITDELYSPSGFRVAMATQLLVTATGVIGILVLARRVRRVHGPQSV